MTPWDNQPRIFPSEISSLLGYYLENIDQCNSQRLDLDCNRQHNDGYFASLTIQCFRVLTTARESDTRGSTVHTNEFFSYPEE